MTLKAMVNRGATWAPIPCTLAALVLLTSVGCELGGRDRSFTVRDSSGVRIAESSDPAWNAEKGWTVGDAPILDVGVTDGPEEYQFSLIVGAWRLGDGRIGVADRMASQIRLYDSDGRFLTSAGGDGDAPGEFRALMAAEPYRGDSIVAWDGGSRRLSVFDGHGGLGRTQVLLLPPPTPQGSGPQSLHIAPAFIGAFEDGTFVMVPPIVARGTPGDRSAWDATLLHYSADGDSLGSLGVFAAGEYLAPRPGAPMIGTPFPRPFSSAIRGSRLYVASGSAYEIQVLGPDGQLVESIWSSHRELALDPDVEEAWREAQRQRASSRNVTPAELERALADVDFPPTLPPFSQILVDSEDHLWVRDYRLPGAEGPAVWSVFDPEGRLLGAVETPEGLRVEQIGREFILGIWTDELDVPIVQAYSLRRR